MMQNSKYTVLMSVYYKEKPEYLSLSIESMLNQTVIIIHGKVMNNSEKEKSIVICQLE